MLRQPSGTLPAPRFGRSPLLGPPRAQRPRDVARRYRTAGGGGGDDDGRRAAPSAPPQPSPNGAHPGRGASHEATAATPGGRADAADGAPAGDGAAPPPAGHPPRRPASHWLTQGGFRRSGPARLPHGEGGGEPARGAAAGASTGAGGEGPIARLRGLVAAALRGVTSGRHAGGQLPPRPSAGGADASGDRAGSAANGPPSPADYQGGRREEAKGAAAEESQQSASETAAQPPQQAASGFPTLPSAIAARRRADAERRGGTFGDGRGSGAAEGVRADAAGPAEAEPAVRRDPAPPPMQPSPRAAAASTAHRGRDDGDRLRLPLPASLPPSPPPAAGGPTALLRGALSRVAGALVRRGAAGGSAAASAATAVPEPPASAALGSAKGSARPAPDQPEASLSARDDLRELARLAARQRLVAARLGARWLRDPFSACLGLPALGALQLQWWAAQAAAWRPVEVLLGRTALVGVVAEQLNERFLMAGHPNVHQQFAEHPALAPAALLAVALLGSLGARLGDGLGAARRAAGRGGSGGGAGGREGQKPAVAGSFADVWLGRAAMLFFAYLALSER
ncbi:hypothetical protein Rsub_06882 [Raphidocelis subcapitata]|uniref:Uncharacterized protein n=1 Tax=Raphidocelis subcapitata TaxID=307507 RepID=A0A2V0P7N1_9CHLO|nr:hypothetical protein Rsub_06882 [Raphidocelis subcapitata]|eukprot:GBF93883.1 hypothetical protein Rsub_06882 [Raphidocelis subcapitata]